MSNVKVTKLVTKTVNKLADAALLMGSYEIVGNEKRIPMIIEPNRNPCEQWLAIPEGFHALITRHSRYIGRWEAGWHHVWPHERISHLITQQYVVFDTPVKECPTMDNVFVEIDVSVVFHVKEGEEDVKNFVYKLGPNRLEQLLNAYQEESVRSMCRQKKYSNIYDLMDTEELDLPKPKEDGPVAGTVAAEPVEMPGQVGAGGAIEMTQTDKYVKMPTEAKGEADDDEENAIDLTEQLENTKRNMNDKLAAYGINVYSITITNVHLPDEFRMQMEEATTFESKNIRAAAEQKYELLVIEDNEKRNQAEQWLIEEKQEAISVNDQRMANEMKITATYQAGTRAMIADIEQKMRADVLEAKTTSELAVSQLNKAKEVELAQVEAEAVAESRKILSEMESFVMTSRADSKAQVATLDAQCLAKQGAAEAEAASKLKAKRDYLAKMSQLRIIKNLANNSDCTIMGTNKDNPTAQLVASKNTAVSLSL